MRRAAALALALLVLTGQVVGGVSTLCVEEDGRSRVELLPELCCASLPMAAAAAAREAAESDAPLASAVPPQPDCRCADAPLQDPGERSRTGARAACAELESALALPPAGSGVVFTVPGASRAPRAVPAAPPRPPVFLAHLGTVLLLC